MTGTGKDILALLDEHGPRLFALLVRLTLRADVADDLLQELFCKLTRSNGFHRATDPAAYAFRAAANLAFDYRRSQKRGPRAEFTAADGLSRDGSPLVDLIRREELERVLDAIGKLPRTSRDIVVLRYLERQDFETIAEQFGKTPHQVRALCHKGIVLLRRALGENVSAEREPEGR